MKKMLIILMILMTFLLVSCDTKDNEYIGSVLKSNYPDDFFLDFITDFDRFESIISNLYDYSDDRYKNSDDYDEYLKLVSSITEETFINSNVYMESFEVGSGSFRYKISEVVEDGNKATVKVGLVGTYDLITHDMARHFVYAIVSKNIDEVVVSSRTSKEIPLNYQVNICTFDIEAPTIVTSYTELFSVFSGEIPNALFMYDEDYFLDNELVLLSLPSSGQQLLSPKRIFLPEVYMFTNTIAICIDFASDQAYDASVIMNYFIFEIPEKLNHPYNEVMIIDWTIYY